MHEVKSKNISNMSETRVERRLSPGKHGKRNVGEKLLRWAFPKESKVAKVIELQ